MKWLERRSSEAAAARLGGGDSDRIEEDEAKRRRAVALMVQDEIDAAERLREVVAESIVSQVVAREYSEVRKSLLFVGAKVGSRCRRTPAAAIPVVPEPRILWAAALLRGHDSRRQRSGVSFRLPTKDSTS